jgi:spore coat polysaccharide biosynthesis protein SpsF
VKTGILINARLGSTRLKRKHLIEVDGRPIFHYLVERIRRGFQEEILGGRVVVIVATSDEPENRALESFQTQGLSVFYGSIHNIPLRHLQAAEHHALDGIVSVDGDDILCSIEGMRAVRRALLAGTDYVKTSGPPFGMNVFGYSCAFLKSSIESVRDETLETGWGRIFDASRLRDIAMDLAEQECLRFTLDYDEDFRFLDAVIRTLGESVYAASDREIINLVLDRQLFRINETVCKEYWLNFHRQKELEEKNINR